MQRILLVIFLGVVAALNAADFRTVSWGMTPEVVKKAEVAKLENEADNELLYTLTVGGQPLEVRYFFDQGKLISAQYEFSKQYRETEKYVQAYDAVQSQLEQKYGQPVTAAQHCEDDFYASVPRRWGTGIVVGKLTRDASWIHGKVLVKHSIRALPGGAVGHVVAYESAQDLKNDLSNAEVYGAL